MNVFLSVQINIRNHQKRCEVKKKKEKILHMDEALNADSPGCSFEIFFTSN